MNKYLLFYFEIIIKKIFIFIFERIIKINIYYFILREIYIIIMFRDDSFIDLTQILNETQYSKNTGCFYTFINFFKKIYKKIF